MSYYNTAREHVKSLKAMQESASRRSERRTELAGVSAEQPLNLLRVDARPASLTRNYDQYRAVENMEGMIPWNGNEDNLIDRFDGRALLDFYREPIKQCRQKTDEEEQLEELVAFESYRDLVKLLQLGLDDVAGIKAAELENVELRANARTAAASAAGVPVNATRPASSTATPSGFGQFGAVGFSYDVSAEAAPVGSDDSSSDDSDDESVPKLGEEEIDGLAANLGIADFSFMLRRAERQEADFAAGNMKKPKRMFSRKKAAQRAKRMAGQGLEAFPKTAPALPADRRDRLRDVQRRSSPSYDAYRARSESHSRSRSRSRSPRRRPRQEFITSFSAKPSRKSAYNDPPARGDNGEQTASTRADRYLDALPSAADPAVDGGPVSLPASGIVMHGIRASDLWARGHDRRRGQEHSSDRDRRRSEERKAPPVAAAPKPAAKPAKETPMERMKRLRAAALNKTFQKDVLTTTQKKANEERDRLARLQHERVALERRRSRSPSPRRYGRSRSRSYSPHRRSRSREGR